jgi:thioredoxin reductase (NADPH)
METLGQDLETMRRVPLATAHVDGIGAIGDEVFYPAGSIVMDIGVPMDRFIHVLEGDIEVVDPDTNERMLKSSLGPTQFLGEIGFLNGATNIMRMRASVDTRVIEAPRQAMLELMSQVPELSDHLITVIAARRRGQFEANNDTIKVIGADRDPNVQAVERFLSRNRIPFQSCDMDATDG